MNDLSSLMDTKPNPSENFFIEGESQYGWCSHSAEYEHKSLYVCDWAHNQIESEFSGIEATINNTGIILIASYTV